MMLPQGVLACKAASQFARSRIEDRQVSGCVAVLEIYIFCWMEARKDN